MLFGTATEPGVDFEVLVPCLHICDPVANLLLLGFTGSQEVPLEFDFARVNHGVVVKVLFKILRFR